MKPGLGAAAILLAATLLVAAPGTAMKADAGPVATCTYVEAGRPGPRDNRLEVSRESPGSRPLILTRAGDEIVVKILEPARCAGRTPTVTNVDRIVVSVPSTRLLWLNLRRGRFAPGATEVGAGAEIEVVLRGTDSPPVPTVARVTVITGDRSDKITVGRTAGVEQANLNPRMERRDDPDLFVPAVVPEGSRLGLYLNGGEDLIDARGAAFEEPTQIPAYYHPGDGADRSWGSDGALDNHIHDGWGEDLIVAGDGGGHIQGGVDDDVLVGGAGRDLFHGGRGVDVVRAGAGNDSIRAVDGNAETIRCGPGDDHVSADGDDILEGCESVAFD